jgi:transketolase
VEDHFAEGGLGEAVLSALDIPCCLKILAVRKIPISGKPFELLNYESISKDSIIFQIKNLINSIP